MEFILPLIAGHFIADYNLQSNALVKFKSKSWAGLLLHSGIHFLVYLAVLFPFLNEARFAWATLLLFLLHFVTDWTKIRTRNRKPKWNGFVLYLLDQAVHIVVIYLVSVYMLVEYTGAIAYPWSMFYQVPMMWLYLTIAVLSTYFYDVTRWIYRSTKQPGLKYERDYRMMIRNFVIVTVAFVLYFAN